MRIIPGEEPQVTTYIGEPADIEMMEAANTIIFNRAEVIKLVCPKSPQCGAMPLREQFGDGINIARVDTYYVGCELADCEYPAEPDAMPHN